MKSQTSLKLNSIAENGLGRLLYRVAEVCSAAALSRADVYRRINTGEIPHVRIGRSIRVPATGLTQWIEQLQENAA
jgi:excisionase family DNA binding protein